MNKRIVIIGGGVVGLATAWELIKRGHQVQLLERNAEPGSATEFCQRRTIKLHRYVAPLPTAAFPAGNEMDGQSRFAAEYASQDVSPAVALAAAVSARL
ncbi:NAD(P)/FAD-dependent oxidoreductase [Klebsiella pneumoniae subsp. pneumoniae]|nr:NAD(P)/FAD-dependent oxidoreductase [Klebsiella pneumoniae subsp. pneumoniae]